VADAYGKTEYPLKVSVVNTPPVFTVAPTNQVINVSSVLNYAMPTIYDAEGQPVTLSVLYLGNPTLPMFVTHDSVK
jgi:hypothetical protein